MSATNSRTGVIPASLSFFAIYNPSLSSNDESLQDQLVYYYSNNEKEGKSKATGGDIQSEQAREAVNERLRQIGLAQGMVEFAKGFSNGEPVEAIETEKSRIVLHELEPGWWILASIGLTRIISSSETTSNTTVSSKIGFTTEYSTREVSPPELLLQQLLRAHQIFLLHHAPTLADLYILLPRKKFCRSLKLFWDDYIWGWDVLLNGNPAIDVFNGLKLAAGGELGIGVGEEEWGSGEREVLEGFIERTDGLIDLIVSRFGDAPQADLETEQDHGPTSHLSTFGRIPISDFQGSTQHLRPSDGVIFSGNGSISRVSVKGISSWVESLHKHGSAAYGIRYNPAAARRRKERKQSHAKQSAERNHKNSSHYQTSKHNTSFISEHQPTPPAGIPAPIVRATNSLSNADKSTLLSSEGIAPRNRNESHPGQTGDTQSGAETLMKYLTLGVYGSKWGIPFRSSSVPPNISHSSDNSRVGASSRPSSNNLGSRGTCHGYFLIGLQGGLDEDIQIENDKQDGGTGKDHESSPDSQSWNTRTMLRTLYVERAKQKVASSSSATAMSSNAISVNEPSGDSYYDRVRVVVYVQKPFTFTFLFELHTYSIAMPSFYHSLHHQLGPLQRPLLASTSPNKVSERLWEASAPKSTSSAESSQPICDLVYDPINLTVHTTIPNIPEPTGAAPKASDPGVTSWTRVEALSVHSQILNTYASTRRNSLDLERTCKTSRGWWVVWMRLPQPPGAQYNHAGGVHREAFLIRKASDYVSPTAQKPRGRFGFEIGRASAGNGWGPGKLAEGIGIDARQYIDGLLSLNR